MKNKINKAKETLLTPIKSSKNEISDNEGDFDCDLEYEDDKERITEHSPCGRFIRFNEELGIGAFKTVYKAYDNDSGCEVAWNVIKLQNLPISITECNNSYIKLLDQIEERKRILDEINLLKLLKHPNIISFISAWINKRKEEAVFITEIVSGGSLKNYMKKIKSPRLKVIKSWCREILLALDYLHGMTPNPIIHRDLKCENIFINSNKGEIRIGDLGLATCMSISFANSVIGTPHFMAPEMYEEKYDTGVDIYSFGMCLLEMITLQIPYKECENPAQVFKKVISGKKPQSIEMIQNEDVKNFIIECLKDRNERPTASQLLQSRFLTKPDEGDNTIVKFIDESPFKTNDEQDPSASKLLKKSNRDGFIPVNAEGFEQILTSNKEDQNSESQKNPDESPRQKIVENKLAKQTNEASQISPLKDENAASPNEHREILTENQEDDSVLHYELRLKSIFNSYIYIVVKIKSQEKRCLNKKLIQIDRRMFTIEALSSHIMKEFRIQTISTRFQKAISAFVETSELALSAPSSKKQYYSNTANTSYSTLNLGIAGKLYETTNQSADRGIICQKRDLSRVKLAVSVLSNATSAYFFESDCFLSYYHEYLNSLPKDYFSHENEEAMTLRQKAELIDLQKIHLLQKKSLLDRRQAYLNNIVGFPRFSDNSNVKDYDEGHKPLNLNGIDPMFLSPISSGYISPDDILLNDEHNYLYQNNSAEIVSMIGKFNSHNSTICGECNKSSLLVAVEEIAQNSGVNSVFGDPIQLQGFNGYNSSTQLNSRLTPMISPKRTIEFDLQQSSSQPKKVYSYNNSQKNIFSPDLLQQQSRRVQQENICNKPVTPQNLIAAVEEYQKTLKKSSNEKYKLQKQISLEPSKNNHTNQGDYYLKNNNLSKNKKTSDCYNSLRLTKAVWSDPIRRAFEVQQKDTLLNNKGDESPDKIKTISSPSNSNLQPKKTIFHPSNFINETPIKSISSDDTQHENTVSQVNLKSNSSNNPVDKFSNKILKSQSLPEKKTDLITESSEIAKLESHATTAMIDKIMKHTIKGQLQREGLEMNEEDVKIFQKCLEMITNTPLEANGIFGYYTEKILKIYQEKNNLITDGVVTEQLWRRMREDLEKKLETFLNDKKREIKEIAYKASEDKKILKEKQTKESRENLHKIQAELTDLSNMS